MAKERTSHSPSHAEAEKVKSLKLHVHYWLMVFFILDIRVLRNNYCIVF